MPPTLRRPGVGSDPIKSAVVHALMEETTHLEPERGHQRFDPETVRIAFKGVLVERRRL